MRKVVKPILEVLAGVPTVAFGFFALAVVTPALQDHWPSFLGDGPGIFNVLAGGLAIGLLIVPIIASISEDAMSAVPGGLREGAYALGATKMKVATRVVFPAALSGIVASIILAVSRAIGETMVVLLAAGNTPNLSFNPTEAVQTMTAFIATTATGDIATGTITYKTIFAVGAAPVRDDAGHEHARDPARAQVPGGLRMSGARGWEPRGGRAQLATAGARGVTAAVLSDQPRKDIVRNTMFAAILFLAIALALAGLGWLIADSLIKGAPRLNADLLTNGTSSLPANAGLKSALIGTLWIMAFVILLIVPIGIGAAVYLEEYANKEGWLAPPDRGEHPEPRRGAVDHLRPARPGLHRPRPARPRLRHPDGFDHADAAGAADRHPRRA